MSNTEVMEEKKGMFSKKDLHRLEWRFLFHGQAIGWNYERMMGLGYLATMIPAIDRLYANDPEMKQKALETHDVFFNTAPMMAPIIIGMDVAIEEENPNETGLAMAASIKSALMGPFAGIGDTIFGMIMGSVCGSIEASMALQGSAMGIVIGELIWAVVTWTLKFKFIDLGYSQGMKLVTSMSNTMNALVDAASTMGLVVVGGMIATMVHVNLATITVQLGVDSAGNAMTASYDLQSYADAIMPQLLPALLAMLCYWLLGKKWMNSNKLIWMMIAFAILMRLLGVFTI
jgi:PTS system mannose-specific IID component